MDNKVVELGNYKKKEPVSKKYVDDLEGFSMEAEIDKDIEKLMKATGLTREESIQLAKNFYRSYPMLLEFIRTPNEMLKR